MRHFAFFIDFSSSLSNGVKSNVKSEDGLGLDARPTSSWELNDGVDGLGIGAPSNFDVFLKFYLL